ncbi:MAG: OTU domain-containing protein [Arenibacterium sp.]
MKLGWDDLSSEEEDWVDQVSDELSVERVHPGDVVNRGPFAGANLPAPALGDNGEPVSVVDYLEDQLLDFLDSDDFFVAEDLKLTCRKVLEKLGRSQIAKLINYDGDNQRALAARDNFFADGERSATDLVLFSVNYLAQSGALTDQDRRDMEYLLGRRDTCLSPGDVAIKFNEDGTLSNRFSGFAEVTNEFLKGEAGRDESSTFANRHVVAAHGMRNAFNLLVNELGADEAEQVLADLLHDTVEASLQQHKESKPDASRHQRYFQKMDNDKVWSDEARILFWEAYQEVEGKCSVDWVLKHHFPPGWVQQQRNELVGNGGDPKEVDEYLKQKVQQKREVIISLYLMNSNPENLWRGSAAVNSAIPQKYKKLAAKVAEFDLDPEDEPENLIDEMKRFLADLAEAHRPTQALPSKKTKIIDSYLSSIEPLMQKMASDFEQYIWELTTPFWNEEPEGIDEEELHEKVVDIKQQLVMAYARMEVDLLGGDDGNEAERSSARDGKASADFAMLQALSEAMEEDFDFGVEDVKGMFKSLLNFNEMGLVAGLGGDDEDEDEEAGASQPKSKKARIKSDADMELDSEEPASSLNALRLDRRGAQLESLEKLNSLFGMDVVFHAQILELYEIGMLGSRADMRAAIFAQYENGGLTQAQLQVAQQRGGAWQEVARDGNCLFHCLAAKLQISHKELRKLIADAIRDRNQTLMPYVANPAIAEAEIRRDGSYVGEAAFMTHYAAILFNMTIEVIEENGQSYSLGVGATHITLARACNHYWYLG